ncbi:major tail protein [Mycobacterium phage MalagasyRose]|uniref:Major tail protein n=1 Tax=Mycobacterium phage MalagasyRose TaxID=2599870 RepID=A0A5J6TGI5_9CAUD|nr:major tail protein [Mycobacterium phage MalagasyRose]QFG08869.1 major tail protein [Mycobacterium phage MalagasyRose]
MAVGDVNNIILPTPKNVTIQGGLYVDTLDATVPGADFVIPTTAKLLGFLSDDALDEDEQRARAKKFGWGGDTVANPQESYALTLGFTLLEFLNLNVAKVAYGDANVTETAANATHGKQLLIHQTADTLGMRSWTLDTFSAGGKRVQKFFPMGEVESKKTQKWSHKEILAHALVVSFYPDASGRYSYTRTDDGVLSA